MFKVGAAYAVVGWLLIQVAAIVFPTFEAPRWVMLAFVTPVILGFQLALGLVWAFEISPAPMAASTEPCSRHPR